MNCGSSSECALPVYCQSHLGNATSLPCSDLYRDGYLCNTWEEIVMCMLDQGCPIFGWMKLKALNRVTPPPPFFLGRGWKRKTVRHWETALWLVITITSTLGGGGEDASVFIFVQAKCSCYKSFMSSISTFFARLFLYYWHFPSLFVISYVNAVIVQLGYTTCPVVNLVCFLKIARVFGAQ